MGTTIELSPEQLEEIVPAALMESYEMIVKHNFSSKEEENVLLVAIDRVLQYYMPEKHYLEWKLNILEGG